MNIFKPKMEVWKMNFLFNWVGFFRFHVKFLGCKMHMWSIIWCILKVIRCEKCKLHSPFFLNWISKLKFLGYFVQDDCRSKHACFYMVFGVATLTVPDSAMLPKPEDEGARPKKARRHWKPQRKCCLFRYVLAGTLVFNSFWLSWRGPETSDDVLKCAGWM